MSSGSREKRRRKSDQGAASGTDRLGAFQVRLPGTAAQLGFLLCLPAASSVWGRTPASRRMYPERKTGTQIEVGGFPLSQYSFFLCIYFK